MSVAADGVLCNGGRKQGSRFLRHWGLPVQLTKQGITVHHHWATTGRQGSRLEATLGPHPGSDPGCRQLLASTRPVTTAQQPVTPGIPLLWRGSAGALGRDTGQVPTEAVWLMSRQSGEPRYREATGQQARQHPVGQRPQTMVPVWPCSTTVVKRWLWGSCFFFCLFFF